jgi:hypothetical protein
MIVLLAAIGATLLQAGSVAVRAECRLELPDRLPDRFDDYSTTREIRIHDPSGAGLRTSTTPLRSGAMSGESHRRLTGTS